MKGTEAASLFVPLVILFTTAILAALPAAVSAIRIDPVEMLGTE